MVTCNVLPTVLPVYKKPNVPVLYPVEGCEIVAEREKKVAFDMNLVWALARYMNRNDQLISSWTGFNMLARRNKSVLKDMVGYLPTIDSPATQMNTVYEILTKAKAIKDALNLKSIVIVFDQAIYAKAIEITWKHQKTFEDIVLRLGTFHTICVLLAVIGLRFGPAGLKDVIIESNVIAEGSTEKVLSGKHYNRSIRFHKLMNLI